MFILECRYVENTTYKKHWKLQALGPRTLLGTHVYIRTCAISIMLLTACGHTLSL